MKNSFEHERERTELAAQQELLLSALLAHGEPPSAVAGQQIEAAASSLFRKRARSIAGSHPDLVNGEAEYLRDMKDYAALYPGSHVDGICADADRFRLFMRSKQRERCPHIFQFLKARILSVLNVMR